MAGLFQELKRRNVVRVGVAYIVVGWVGAQIAELLFEAFGTPDWVLKTVIVLIAIGFPFALIFAWAFELTPDGLKKTRDVDLDQSITPRTGQKLNYVIIAALVVALGYFIWERQTLERRAPEATEAVAAGDATLASADEPEEITQTTVRRSIAVLPFVNMSSDKEQDWFADGLTEEILNSLARTPDLLVAARTSSFGYKGSTEAVPQIASELGVDHVLEGSVRKGGDKLRITAQLIRANDGFHLWSETYDRNLDDIITIQEDIAVQIADALETAMDPDALAAMMDVGTSSVPAYEAYLKGRGAQRATAESGDPYLTLEAIQAYERATELDPEFARAYAAISVFWSLQLAESQLVSGITDVPRDEQIARRDAALEKAVRYAKDPVDEINYRADQAWNAFDYRRALRLKAEYLQKRPNDDENLSAYLLLMLQLGKYEDAAKVIRQHYESALTLTREFANSAAQHLRDPKETELMRVLSYDAIDKFADDITLLYQVHRMLLWAGDIDGASRIVPKLLGSDLPEENRLLVQLRQACAENRVADGEKLRQTAMDKLSDRTTTLWLAAHIMSDTDAADRILEQYDEQSNFLALDGYANYPQFDPKRFPNFMRKVAGQGFEERPVLDLPYRCKR